MTMRKEGGARCSLRPQIPGKGRGTAWRESHLRRDVALAPVSGHRQRRSDGLPCRELRALSSVNRLTLGAHRSNLPGMLQGTQVTWQVMIIQPGSEESQGATRISGPLTLQA